MSLVLMKPELDIWSPGAHSGTFRGNNLAFITATQALVHYWTTGDFEESLFRKANTMDAWLNHIARAYPEAGFSVRGRGMIQGLATADAGLAEKITSSAFQEGLVIETSGSEDQVIKLLPALTIEDQTLREGLDILERSVAKTLGVNQTQADKIRFIGGAR
jgi:diaminobutyrate-2-oxoglutarate transaminase